MFGLPWTLHAVWVILAAGLPELELVWSDRCVHDVSPGTLDNFALRAALHSVPTLLREQRQRYVLTTQQAAADCPEPLRVFPCNYEMETTAPHRIVHCAAIQIGSHLFHIRVSLCVVF